VTRAGVVRAGVVLAAALLLGACNVPRPLPPPLPPLAVDEAGAAERSEAEAEVLAMLQRYYRDLSSQDFELLRRDFWPEATLTTTWQAEDSEAPEVTVITIDEFIAEAPNGPGSKEIFEETMTSAHVRVHGDLAQVWARYDARFGDPGEIYEWSGIDAFTLIRHEGEWRIAALVFAADH
jgi:hypothetical protein